MRVYASSSVTTKFGKIRVQKTGCNNDNERNMIYYQNQKSTCPIRRSARIQPPDPPIKILPKKIIDFCPRKFKILPKNHHHHQTNN
jgi:hypothetical protein